MRRPSLYKVFTRLSIECAGKPAELSVPLEERGPHTEDPGVGGTAIRAPQARMLTLGNDSVLGTRVQALESAGPWAGTEQARLAEQ